MRLIPSSAHRRTRRTSLRVAAAAATFFGVLALGQPTRASAQDQLLPGRVLIDTIRVTGNVRQSEAAILSLLGLAPGTALNYRDIRTALKRLWATGQFEDISVRAQGEGTDPVVLIFEVEERDLIRRIEIRGLEHASAQIAQDTIGLKAGEPYSPTKVNDVKIFIRAQLSKAGIPFASIEERRIPIPGREKEAELILEVTEGQRVTIAQVSFTGNEEFSGDELRSAMGTKAEGFWWFRSGSFNETGLNEDLGQTLPRYYSSSGYLDFEILADTLIVDPETGKSRLEIQVSEGKQYRLADFSMDGNRRFPTDQLEGFFRFEEGGLFSSLGIGDGERQDPVFNAMDFENATFAVQELYSNQGYLYARVEPWIEKVDVEGGEPSVQVGWRIDEGLPAYVNRIIIDGNDFTYDRVLREQIFLLPGDLFSRERLIQSYRAVSALGFFETPLEFPDVRPDPATGDVDITFHVKERQTGSINFGTAVGGAGSGLSGFLGYQQPNLFGQAKNGSIRWDFGRFVNSFTLTYTDPALLRSRISGTISLFNSRDRFFSFNAGRRRRAGGSLRVGLPVPGSLRARFFVGYSLSRTKFTVRQGVTDVSLFGRPPGTQSQLSLSLVRQTLNHPAFPTSGSRQSITTEFNGGLLGGDGDFTKQTAEGTWWVPIGQIGGGDVGSTPIRFALGLSLKGGAIFGNPDRFPFDRFWMGGVQFGQRLRGYDETEITPLGFFPERSPAIADINRLGNAFLSLTAEYAMRVNDNLSASAFYDAGNVYRSASRIDPTRLFRGAGFGVQLVTPFGPIGIDYAYGFDKTTPGWQLHFRMGQGF